MRLENVTSVVFLTYEALDLSHGVSVNDGQ